MVYSPPSTHEKVKGLFAEHFNDSKLDDLCCRAQALVDELAMAEGITREFG